MTPAASDNVDKEPIQMSFSDLVHVVRQEYTSMEDYVSYSRAAKIVDKAIEPHIKSSNQELLSRVDKDVIGDDEKLKILDTYRDHKVIRNHLRMKQRQKLNKLGDSL